MKDNKEDMISLRIERRHKCDGSPESYLYASNENETIVLHGQRDCRVRKFIRLIEEALEYNDKQGFAVGQACDDICLSEDVCQTKNASLSVLSQCDFSAQGPGEWKYSIEVDGQIDQVEEVSADSIRALIKLLQRALDDHEKGGRS